MAAFAKWLVFATVTATVALSQNDENCLSRLSDGLRHATNDDQAFARFLARDEGDFEG